MQDLFQQRQRQQPSGGVVGGAEEYRLRLFLFQKGQKALIHIEILRLMQEIPLYAATHLRQSRPIFHKGGGQLYRRPGPQGGAVSVDQVRRAVSAENIGRRHLLVGGNGLHQLAAVGVGVAVQLWQPAAYRLQNAGGRAKRVGVGGKIQCDTAAVYIAAVLIFCLIQHLCLLYSAKGSLTPQLKSRVRMAVTVIRRHTRGMSSWVISRDASPIYSFLCSTP